MKSILEKLSAAEIKELAKKINENQKKYFGNPLSLRKQEMFMSDLFGAENWQTLLGLAEKNKNDEKKCNEKKYDPKAKWFKTKIVVEVLSEDAPYGSELVREKIDKN